MAKFKVGICSLLCEKDIEIEREVLKEDLFEIIMMPYGSQNAFREGVFDDVLEQIHGLIMANTYVDARVAPKLKNCKVVARHGQGLDSLDLKACADHGIAVCNMPAFGVDEVSDHALAFSLLLMKSIHTYSLDVRRGSWNVEKVQANNIKKINQSTLSLLGFGRIGQETARKARALFGRVMAYDPFMNLEKAKELGVEPVSDVGSLFREADVLSVHIPLNKDTTHFIDRGKLMLMKPTAYVVNTARGPLINGKDLYQALSEGWIAGAALDVMEHEPPDMADPLFGLDNVIFTPHSAFVSDRSLPDLRRHCAEEVRRVLMGEQPLSRVN